MKAHLKIYSGAILILPAVLALGYAIVFRFDNPALTETQLFNEVGWTNVVAVLFSVPGAALIYSGLDDYNDE